MNWPSSSYADRRSESPAGTGRGTTANAATKRVSGEEGHRKQM
jgi:hypothetical protein